jgi:hypothetical protein
LFSTRSKSLPEAVTNSLTPVQVHSDRSACPGCSSREPGGGVELTSLERVVQRRPRDENGHGQLMNVVVDSLGHLHLTTVTLDLIERKLAANRLRSRH